MKILIMVDMEGISGVFCPSQMTKGNFGYEEARQMMVDDVNACVDGCVKGGATEIIVRDAHCDGYNLIWSKLDPRAQYIQGQVEIDRMPEIETCDGVILLGYHAMAGTPQGVLEHTMSSREWQNFHINGKLAGEVAIDAAYAADYDVPVIMVSGDDKLAEEVKELLPETVYAKVKEGLGIAAAKLLPAQKAYAVITENAEFAVSKCKEIKALQLEKPLTIRLELVSRGKVPYRRESENIKIIDGRTFECMAPTMKEAMNLLFG